MITDSPATLDRGAIAFTLGCIAAACYTLGLRALAAGIRDRAVCAWYEATIMWPHTLRRHVLRALGRRWPDEGKHSPNATMTPADAYLTPAPREADSAGQAPDAATVLPPDGAAPLPQPQAVPPSADGLGQHPQPPVQRWRTQQGDGIITLGPHGVHVTALASVTRTGRQPVLIEEHGTPVRPYLTAYENDPVTVVLRRVRDGLEAIGAAS